MVLSKANYTKAVYGVTLQMLNFAQQMLVNLIQAIPSGLERNALSEANIFLGEALERINRAFHEKDSNASRTEDLRHHEPRTYHNE